MPHHAAPVLEDLAQALTLGALLERIRERWGKFRVLDHWQQGEFHHDIVLALDASAGLPGPVLLVSTTCNGAVKEVQCLAAPPDRDGLWRLRCPENGEFNGPLPQVLASARTLHWFEPRELLGADARSELQAQHRVRQPGGC